MSDWDDPETVEKPSPTIVVEFENPIEMDTLETNFNYYPETEDGRDFENPEDKNDILSLMEESSNLTVMRYNLSEELVDNDYYTVHVTAEVREKYRTEDGEEMESAAVQMEECRLLYVDFGPLDFKLVSPEEEYISDPDESLIFETNRRATCYISENSDEISLMDKMATTGAYEHKNTHPGSDYFYVTCETSSDTESKEMNLILDTTPPTITEIDDTSRDEEYPDIHTNENRKDVCFYAEDESSGVDLINYTIYENETDSKVMAWTTTDRIGDCFMVLEDDEGNVLDLEDGKEYYFVAKALDNAGSWSEEKESDGFKVDLDFDPETSEDPCEEFGTDCEVGETCEDNSSCLSGFCHPDNSTCAEPSCDDDFQNGDQSDVDCGGDDCEPCEEGKDCQSHSDCITEFCDPVERVCAEQPEEEGQDDVELDPVDEETEERNFLMPILMIVLTLGIIGGSFYGYKNRDKIQSLLRSSSHGSTYSQQTPSQTRSKAGTSHSATASEISNQKSQPNKSQIQDMGAKVSHRLKKKEEKRERDNLFGDFSSASSVDSSNKKPEDEKETVTKKDIDSLFGGVK
ncbi:MAG: hypothetical protein ACLFTR_02160 [Candidatus Woesearchaeota archaeon]